jgi:hypothetical protein
MTGNIMMDDKPNAGFGVDTYTQLVAAASVE